MSVALSATHGGCGAAHHRPVTHGAPDAVWALNCVPCENHLRHDPLWAVMPSDIPETPDEERVRDDRDKKGALDRDRLLTDAILTIAQTQGNLPDQLARALLTLQGGTPPPVDFPCRAGHPNKIDSRFCSTCGVVLEAPMVDAVPEDNQPWGLPEAGVRVNAPEPTQASTDLTQMTTSELRALAQDLGIDHIGNKRVLIERISQAS